jgi:hypothetical protein
MLTKAEIQVQDQFGNWHHFQTVPIVGTEVYEALKRALSSPLAKKSKKVRAIDIKTGALIDLLTK